MSHDCYGLPLASYLSGYSAEIEEQQCIISNQRRGDRRVWSVRGLQGGEIAAGRTVAHALREARRVLREREEE